MRERWFGATGTRVPEIALEGMFDPGDALVLDDVADGVELRKAHEQGRPVIVLARTADEVRAALARPEVACVLVRDESLLSLDLTELTYGS